MRKPYRRQRSGLGRTVLHVGLGVFVATAVCQRLLSSLPADWQSLSDGQWIEPAERIPLQLAVIGLVLSAVVRSLSSRWPSVFSARRQAIIEVTETQARIVGNHLRKPKLVLVSGIALILGMPMLVGGVVDLIVNSSAGELSLSAALMGGMLIALAIWSIAGRRTGPHVVVIDRHQIATGRSDGSSFSWASIREVSVRPSPFQRSFSDRDEIHLILRDGSVTSAPKTLSISPRQDLAASPESVLEAIDRFRPAEVPINDPRRIEDDRQT